MKKTNVKGIWVTSLGIFALSLNEKSVAQALVNDYFGQFLIGRYDWSKILFSSVSMGGE